MCLCGKVEGVEGEELLLLSLSLLEFPAETKLQTFPQSLKFCFLEETKLLNSAQKVEN